MKNFIEESIKSYTSDQKIDWFGPGEWVDEFDVVKFYFKDYKCMVFRVVTQEPFVEGVCFGGHFCGYVFLHGNHSFSGENFQDLDIDCHGGITFSEFAQEEGAHLIGFDCAHSGDYVPSMEKLKKQYRLKAEIAPIPKEFEKYSIFNPVYRNVEFCVNECKSIVNQLIEMDKLEKKEPQ